MLFRQIQAGMVTGRKLCAITFPQLPAYGWADRVQDIFTWKVIRRSQLRPPNRFRMALPQHDLAAFIPQLKPCRRMDGIVNAAMAGVKTA